MGVEPARPRTDSSDQLRPTLSPVVTLEGDVNRPSPILPARVGGHLRQKGSGVMTTPRKTAPGYDNRSPMEIAKLEVEKRAWAELSPAARSALAGIARRAHVESFSVDWEVLEADLRRAVLAEFTAAARSGFERMARGEHIESFSVDWEALDGGTRKMSSASTAK